MKKNARILLVTLDGGGNLPPVLGTAKRLQARGHAISVLTEPCLRETIMQAGYAFIPFEKHYTRNDRTEDLIRDANTNPLTNPFFDRVVFGPVGIQVEETLRAIEASHADILLVDCLLPGAAMAAEVKGIPAVLLFHFPEYLPGPNRPPGVMGLTPGVGMTGKLRDRILGSVFSMMLNKYRKPVNAVRSQYGLKPLRDIMELLHLPQRRCIQTLRAFDFPLDPAPANVRYTGPILDDPDWTDTWQDPWQDDERPLVVVSLSTTFQDQSQIIRNCIDALRALPVRALVTIGPSMPMEAFTPADNVHIVRSAPHSQVFPKASLVITHGGHGTIMRALQHGLPVLCIPMGRDQNDNAAKLVYHKLGLQLKPKARPDAINASVRLLLADTSFRQNAAQFASRLTQSQSGMAIVTCIKELIDRP